MFYFQKNDVYLQLSIKKHSDMKQNKHWRLLYFLFTLCPLWLVAQQLTVKGVVKDTDGMEMLGVSIIVKGTQKGVATDGNGRYQIKVQPHDVLVFS